MIDFSKCQLSAKMYGGKSEKIGIVYEGEDWILKFENPGSEYVGSKIYELAGVDAHKTLLGTYNKKRCCSSQRFYNTDLFFGSVPRYWRIVNLRGRGK